jgi:predicted nucleic acid-binding protein
MGAYYLDTSIWLDLFEDRDELYLLKTNYAKELLNKIIKENSKIIFTNLIIDEMVDLGYSFYEIEQLFEPFKNILIQTDYFRTEFGKAKDLAIKRDIPFVDALHAIIARKFKAILITRDHHFKGYS